MNNRRLHHRRSIRMKGYDYSQKGLYFITICCAHRYHLFGHIQHDKMIMNAFGEIALTQWLATEQIRDNIILHECIIMPNHIHGIIEIVFQKDAINKLGSFHSPSQTIGSIVRGFKIATIKKIKVAIENMEEDKENSVCDNNREGEVVDKENEVGGNKSEEIGENESNDMEIGKNEGKEMGKGDGEDIEKCEGMEIDKDKGKEIGKGESKGESKGELQFAPTIAPTSALSELVKSLDYKIWQRNYYEHIIRNEKAYTNISNYIINNPANWKEDKLK